MAPLRIHLLGRFCVESEAGEYKLLGQRKVQELFAYLLLHRDRPMARERLAGMLWEETSTAQSRANLRRTLWQLQSVLAVPQTEPGALLLEGEWVQISTRLNLWLDVDLLETSFKSVNGLPGEQMSDQCALTAAEAVACYHGDLLDGWYQDWCLYERERLQQIYLSLLDKLMGYCEAHGMYDQGIAYGALALRQDQAREQSHRRLMRLHFLAGDRTGALRQYERCTGMLAEALGVRPSELTEELYVQICANRLDPTPPAPATRKAEATLLLPLIQRICMLSERLDSLQQELHSDLQELRRALIHDL